MKTSLPQNWKRHWKSALGVASLVALMVHASGACHRKVDGRALEHEAGRPAADAPVALRRRTGLLVGRAVAAAVNLLDVRLAVRVMCARRARRRR